MGVIAGSVHLSDSQAAFAPSADVSQSHNVIAAYDGALLNLPDLHRELRGSTHPPQSLAAADVLAAGYREWGDQLLTRLRGSFAVALWDMRDRTLLLARDRVGVKSVHYATAAGRLFFASDTKTLLVNPDIDREIDPQSLDHYLAFLLTPLDRSMIRGVRKLPPAHFLRVRDGAVSLHQYWRLPPAATFTGTEDDASRELDARLQDIVARQLAADGGTGILLSGGLNSSLLAAVASRVSNGGAKTLTIRFETSNEQAPDVEGARGVAAHAGTSHHEVVARPDARAVIDEILPILDEPFADASVIPVWYLARASSERFTSVLAGDGHEMFGGCDRYLPPSRVAAFDRAAGRAGRIAAGIASRLLPGAAPGRGFLRHVAMTDRERYLDAMRFCSRDARRELIAADAREAINGGSAEATFGRPFDDLSHLPWQAQMMAFDFQVEVPGDVLMPRTRAGAALNVGYHTPFLDHHIVEFAASLPASMKIRPGRLKHVLREVASRYLPPGRADQPSQGFGLSPSRWFGGSLREAFGDVLGSPAARQRSYLNRPAVERLLREQIAGSRDHTQTLWALLVLETWERAVADLRSSVSSSSALPVVGN